MPETYPRKIFTKHDYMGTKKYEKTEIVLNLIKSNDNIVNKSRLPETLTNHVRVKVPLPA